MGFCCRKLPLGSQRRNPGRAAGGEAVNYRIITCTDLVVIYHRCTDLLLFVTSFCGCFNRQKAGGNAY